MSAARSTPERVTFVIASVVLLSLVGLIVSEVPGSKQPPSPRVKVGEAVKRDGHFEVPVSVENIGESTAENVQIDATLTLGGGDEQTADQTIDFLAAGETEDVVFLFDDDPSSGELEVRVGGFSVP